MTHALGFGLGNAAIGYATCFPRNLLPFSDVFLFGGPVNSTVTANAVTAPDGTLRGTEWQRSSTAAAYTGLQISKPTPAMTYTISGYAEMGTGNFIALRMQGTYPDRADVVFNLSNGTISTAATVSGNYSGTPIATIAAVGGGWYRLSLTATTSGSDANDVISANFSSSANGVVLDGTDSQSNTIAYFFGAMLVLAPHLTPFIPSPQ